MAREEEEIVSEDLEESEPFVSTSSRVPTPGSSSSSSSAEKSQDADPAAASEVPARRAIPFDPSSLASVVVAVLIAMVVTKMASPTAIKPKLWTAEELAKYNGTDKSLPLLLSILGSVFDVTQGRNHYGPGGGYHHFTGRDASRAFVSGNFTDDGLTSSIQGLTALQVKSIDDWKTFLKKKYIYVGTLVGTFYDKEGKPTKELTRVARQVARAAKVIQEQKEDEERFPSCNSHWNQEDGGEVWCKAGYPRIVDRVSEGTYKGTTGTRCACYAEKFLHRKGLKVYEGCAPTERKCQSAPPQVKKS